MISLFFNVIIPRPLIIPPAFRVHYALFILKIIFW